VELRDCPTNTAREAAVMKVERVPREYDAEFMPRCTELLPRTTE